VHVGPPAGQIHRTPAGKPIIGPTPRHLTQRCRIHPAKTHETSGAVVAPPGLIVPSARQFCRIEVRQTLAFVASLNRRRDRDARARVMARIRRLSLGNPGDVKPVSEGVSEMRIDDRPGCRVYIRPARL
jgi:hypothetical protein